ncbi:hypothetical protein SESBI_33532 [Sesbania bispinosa]|nr:hypothetical protein SESBI_33532 [Sesbania bispinosa]
MASPTSRIAFRIVLITLLLLLLFYIGRPFVLENLCYHPRHPQQQANCLSQIVLEAQKTVGWYHDEGIRAKTRKLLLHNVLSTKLLVRLDIL